METVDKKQYMRVKNLMWPNPNICTEREMYFRLPETGAEYVYVKDRIVFRKSFCVVFFQYLLQFVFYRKMEKVYRNRQCHTHSPA